MNELPEEAVSIPIDGVLDLHAFSPKDASSVVEAYLGACLEQSIHEIRIIHGKGKGAIRRTVHSLLERHPDVLDYRLDPGPSGWGATVVRLRPRGDSYPIVNKKTGVEKSDLDDGR